MKKKVSVVVMAVILAVIMAACSGGGGSASRSASGGGSQSNESMDPIGSGAVQFDPNAKVNNGEPIELEYWFWFGEEFFQSVIDHYAKYRPNVTLTLHNQPWSELWTLLPLALNSGGGPPIFNVHNAQNAVLLPFMEPLSINHSDLQEDFVNTLAHIQNGNIYYIDFGLMTSMIYYNKDHWNEAGFTEADYPKTWDELAEKAQALTQLHGDQMSRSGFNVNSARMLLVVAFNLQQGSTMFRDDDKTKANLDNQYTYQSVQRVMDFYDRYKVSHRDFGIDAGESFGIGQTSMIYNWGWFNGFLIENYPDLDFGVFELPTIDKGTPFAYDRFNGESTPGININASAAEKEVGQDFLRFFLASDEDLVDLNLAFGVFPSKRNIQTHPRILEAPSIGLYQKNIERYIWPGPYPPAFETPINIMMENILYLDMDIQEAIKEAQRQEDVDLPPINFTSRESDYQFYNERAK